MSIGLSGVPVYSIDFLAYLPEFLALPPQISLDVHSDPLHVVPDARGHLQIPVLPDQPLLRIPRLHVLDACTHQGPLRRCPSFPEGLLPMLPSQVLQLGPMLLKPLVSLGSACSIEAGQLDFQLL